MIFGSIPGDSNDPVWFLYVPLMVIGSVAAFFLIYDLIESAIKKGRPSPFLAIGVGAGIGAVFGIVSIIGVAIYQDVERDKFTVASLEEIGFSNVDLNSRTSFDAAGPEGQYVSGNLLWDRDTDRYLVVLTKGFTDE